MSQAVGARQCTPATYSLLVNNCQDFAQGLRARYWIYALAGDWESDDYQCISGTSYVEIVNVVVDDAAGIVATKRSGDP